MPQEKFCLLKKTFYGFSEVCLNCQHPYFCTFRSLLILGDKYSDATAIMLAEMLLITVGTVTFVAWPQWK